jgi:hypothetical protein
MLLPKFTMDLPNLTFTSSSVPSFYPISNSSISSLSATVMGFFDYLLMKFESNSDFSIAIGFISQW